MATSLYDSNAPKGDAVQEILKPGCGLTAVKPGVKDETIVRFIPEQTPDGQCLPMVAGFDANGPLFTNLTVEPLVLFAGSISKFHGIVRPSDIPDMPDPDMPFAGLYIKLKGDMGKNRVPADQYMLVNELLKKSAKGSAQLSHISEHALAQVCVLQLNGKPCATPDIKRVLVLTKGGKLALLQCLAQAVADKIDIFDPATGFALKIYGSPKVGEAPQNFIVERAYQCAMPEAAWKGNWVPWDKALKKYTYDELIQKMVQAYGAGVVAMKPSFKEAMDRLGIRSGVASYAPATAPQTAPQAAPAAGAPAGWGATAQHTATPAPTPPAPAAGGWGAPTAPAAQAAPASGGWGVPAKPATVAPPTPTPNASAATAAPVTGDISDLQRAFEAELAKQAPK